MNINDLIQLTQNRLNSLVKLYLQDNKSPSPKLQKAMTYAVLNGGKRIRPLLVYATGYTFAASWENLDIPACAIELVHAYSLIHDDLPAMDNADLRRGQPSCHKAFNEALAILAGDALQPLAFEIIATHPAQLTAAQRIAMTQLLSRALGIHGMAAGQALDIDGTGPIIDMYQLKTGALLSASTQLGAIAANIADPHILNALDQYATSIGLAFQIQDDLLDASTPEATGKPQGLDLANHKVTYVTLHGVEKTQQKINHLFAQALKSIECLGEKATLLTELGGLLLTRQQ